MMSKERLMSNVKECKRQWFEVGDLSPEAFDYLLTQAERSIELEQENETLRSANEDLLKENHTLKNFKKVNIDHPSNKFF